MKRIFIWWHRRRAAKHDAWQACGGSMARVLQEFIGHEGAWHIKYRDWHLAQIERLSK